MHEILQPEGWAKPIGYSNGIAASGRTIFVGGQIGWNANCEFETDDFVGQVRQTLENVVAILKSGGVNIPTGIADASQSAGDHHLAGEMRFPYIGNVYRRDEPANALVLGMPPKRVVKANASCFEQGRNGDIIDMPHDIEILIAGIKAHPEWVIIDVQPPTFGLCHGSPSLLHGPT